MTPLMAAGPGGLAESLKRCWALHGILRTVVLGIVAPLWLDFAFAQAPSLESSPEARAWVDQAAKETLAEFAAKSLKAEQLAVTVVDLRDKERPRLGHVRGEVGVYPASVIKLFYLAAAHEWLAQKRLHDTPELRRALRAMIVDSGNEATHYVIDLLTDTTSGPEMPLDELRRWQDKRNAVTRFFQARGYKGVVAHRKPWYEGPYGREKQAAEAFPPAANSLTTNDTARLLAEIMLGRCVSEKASAEMAALLLRDPHGPVRDPDNQTHGFTGIAVREWPGAKLWSKAGLTSATRHDAACVELPGGRRVIIVTFTIGHAQEREIIPAVARRVLKAAASGPRLQAK